jgi:hypothetical protein
VSLYANESYNSASMGTEFPEDMIYPSSDDVITILDLVAEKAINWREIDDFSLLIRPSYSNVWEFQLNHLNEDYYFWYAVSTQRLFFEE